MPGRPVTLVAHLPRYHHAARALHAAGLLERFVTAPPPPNSWWSFLRTGREHHEFAARRLWVAQAVTAVLRAARARQDPRASLAARAAVWDAAASVHLGRPGVLHAMSGMATRTARVARRNGATIVVDVRGLHPAEHRRIVAPLLEAQGRPYLAPEGPIEARVVDEFARADLLVCNSALTAASLAGHGIDPGRLAVVPLGVDLERFRPAPASPAGARLLFAGRDRWAKGFGDLTRALAQQRLDVELLVTGDPDRDAHDATRNLPGRVTFLGEVPASAMPALYRRCSALVLPSYADGFGQVVLEALASGLPVVVSDRVGAAQVVEVDHNGLIVPAGDVEALGEALARLIGLPSADRVRWCHAARAAAERHDWDAYGRTLVATYHDRLGFAPQR